MSQLGEIDKGFDVFSSGNAGIPRTSYILCFLARNFPMANFSYLRRRVYSAAKFAKNGNQNPRFDTSDIAQESVLQLLKEIKTNGLDVNGVNEAYLQKVGRGNASKLLRRSLAQRRSISSEDQSFDPERIGDETNDPGFPVEQRESVVRLVKMIGKLSSVHQLIIYRRFFDHKPVSEIAAELDANVDSVRRWKRTALKQLKTMLQ